MGELNQSQSEEIKKMTDQINSMFRNYSNISEQSQLSKTRDRDITILLNMFNSIFSNSNSGMILHDPVYKNIQEVLDHLNHTYSPDNEKKPIGFEFISKDSSENKLNPKQINNLENTNSYLLEILQIKDLEIKDLKMKIEEKFKHNDQEKIIHPKQENYYHADAYETNDFKNEVVELQAIISKLKEKNQNLSEENNKYSRESNLVQANNSKLDVLNTKIKEQDIEIIGYKSQMRELENTNISLKNEIHSMENTIENLNSKQQKNNGFNKDYEDLKIDFEKLKVLNLKIEPGIYL